MIKPIFILTTVISATFTIYASENVNSSSTHIKKCNSEAHFITPRPPKEHRIETECINDTCFLNIFFKDSSDLITYKNVYTNVLNKKTVYKKTFNNYSDTIIIVHKYHIDKHVTGEFNFVNKLNIFSMFFGISNTISINRNVNSDKSNLFGCFGFSFYKKAFGGSLAFNISDSFRFDISLGIPLFVWNPNFPDGWDISEKHSFLPLLLTTGILKDNILIGPEIRYSFKFYHLNTVAGDFALPKMLGVGLLFPINKDKSNITFIFRFSYDMGFAL